MKKTVKIIVLLLLITAAITGAVLFFQNYDVAVLNPQGEVARKQRDLIVFTCLLSLVVVVPVFTLLGVIAWKYREGNKRAKYRPDWDNNKWLETIWWGIPCLIILVLGVVTWHTSHDLDPYKPIASDKKPVEVQVVALQWKWLFIYPEQGVASVNLVQFPEKTPVNFSLTSDAPMNAFWIPSLGSQTYAMSGMSSKLHLIADKTGDFKGSSTNISGDGFANMTFTARSSSQADFDRWIDELKRSPLHLDMPTYEKLAEKSLRRDPLFYRLEDKELYDKIVMKYMMPSDSHEKPSGSQGETPADDHNMHNGHDMMNMPEMEGM